MTPRVYKLLSISLSFQAAQNYLTRKLNSKSLPAEITQVVFRDKGKREERRGGEELGFRMLLHSLQSYTYVDIDRLNFAPSNKQQAVLALVYRRSLNQG